MFSFSSLGSADLLLMYYESCDLFLLVDFLLVLFLQSGELADNVSKIIDPQFADKVDMSEVQVIISYIVVELFMKLSKCWDEIWFLGQDEFSVVITKALMTLVHGLETKFDAEMVSMTRVPWASLESVGDQSE